MNFIRPRRNRARDRHDPSSPSQQTLAIVAIAAILAVAASTAMRAEPSAGPRIPPRSTTVAQNATPSPRAAPPGVPSATPTPKPPLQRPVTLKFSSIDIDIVLGELASEVGLVLVYAVDKEKTPRITVDVHDQAAITVLSDIAATNKLLYMQCGRALVVGRGRSYAAYRDTTVLPVTYQYIKPEEAANIVGRVFPYVESKVEGTTVKYQVPRAFVARVKDIATGLDKPK